MSAVILIAGHWLGGWAWEDVTPSLRAAGHDVHPTTLTGLGERAHLSAPEVRLQTHVTDIVNTVLYNDLNDVVIVSHSGGGMPASMAIDQIPERVAKAVYVESGPLPEGMSQADTAGEGVREQLLARLEADPDDWLLPLPSWAELGGPDGRFIAGLDDMARARIAARATPQPIRTATDPVHYTDLDRVNAIPHVLVTCCFPLDQVERMRADNHPMFAGLEGASVEVAELPTGHWPMFSRPDQLADLLTAVARSG